MDPALKAALLGALRLQLQQPAYRLEITTTFGTSSTSRFVEYVAPDRLRMLPGGTTRNELILVGDQGWKKDKGVWVKDAAVTAMLTGGRDTLFGPRTVETLGERLKALEDGGIDDIDGNSAHLYRYTSVAAVQVPLLSKTKLWVRESDGLPIRQEVESESGGQASHMVQLIIYDPTISIQPPAP